MQGRKSAERPKNLRKTEGLCCLFGSGLSGLGFSLLAKSIKHVIITGIATPLPLKLNDATMLKLVRNISKDTVNVSIGPHAKKRMNQRKITQAQVYDCLRMGVISEAAHLNIRGN